MDKESMLRDTCRSELGNGGRKAAGRLRGFSAVEINTPELFQQVFLSSQGVAEALTLLTPDEIRILHLMHLGGEIVGLPFFETLYKPSTTDYWASFTERYKTVFQQVKSNLITRGILLTDTEPEGYRKTSILERRRFLFPEEFAAYLPPLLTPRELDTGAHPETESAILRGKLLQILDPSAPSVVPQGAVKCPWLIEKGQLLLDSQPFTEARLRAWQLASFEAAAGCAKKEGNPPSIVALTRHAFSRLKPRERATADSLPPFWKLAWPKAKLPEPEAICNLGCDWGCLEKFIFQGVSYYRLREIQNLADGLSPENYFDKKDPQLVAIHLRTIPISVLEQLGRVARFQFQAESLCVAPDFVKISHAPLETLQSAWFQWLQTNHAAFGHTCKILAERRGKLVVHQNLLIARVRDLSLKVMIEKQLGGRGQFVTLSNEYLAFSPELLPAIEPLIKKTGNVLKTFNPSTHD